MTRTPLLGLGFAIVLSFTTGCSNQEPPAVYVDLSQIERVLAPPSPEVASVTSRPVASGSTLPGSSGYQLFTGLSQKELEESFSQIKRHQDGAVKKILEQRLKVLDAEIESALASSRSRLEPDHQRLLEDAVAQTRIPFDRVAPRVGKLTLELTNLIGFPDQGQSYRQVDAAWSKARAERVEAIRKELQTLNDQYLSERNAILDQAYRRIARDFESLQSNATVARQEGEARLIAALRKLSAESGAAPLRPSTESYSIPASPPASVRLNAPTEQLPPLNRLPAQRSPLWAAEQKAKIWSAAHGYRLVSRRGEARDATQECLAWIQTQSVGR